MAAGQSDSTWRPILLGRIVFFAMGLVAAGFALFAVVYGGLVQHQGFAILTAAMIAPVGVMFLLVPWMRLTLREEWLEYRNFGAPKQVRWAQIGDAQPGYWGTIITLTGRKDSLEPTTVTAMAVQKSNFSAIVGRTTRADHVAGEIRRRASGARSPNG